MGCGLQPKARANPGLATILRSLALEPVEEPAEDSTLSRMRVDIGLQ